VIEFPAVPAVDEWAQDDKMKTMSLGYRVIRILVRILYPLQAQLHVYHAERVPQDGPLLLVANHLGLTDQFALGLALPRQLRILAKEEVFEWPVIGAMSRVAGLIPVHRGASDRVALQTLVRLLRAGDCVLIHPEGTFARPPEPATMASFKTGAAWLAVKSAAPIMPVGIWGSEYIWAPRRGWRFWRRYHVTVAFGNPYMPQIPLNPAESSGAATKTMLQAVTDEMGYQVAALLPEEYRGYYAVPQSHNPRSIGTIHNKALSQAWEGWQVEGQ
jgi:1-acyl-sn-glycerol-3-phosphate acyltransferase